MAFLIGGANSAADTGYSVANSVRFNSGDSPYMYKTPGSDGNRKTWTFSIWCKRSKIGVRGELFGVYNEDNDLTESFRFNTDDTLMYEEDIAGADYEVSSTRLFRDPSAWYNIVLIRDTTESTEANRVKVFINGVQDTLVESGLGFPAEDGLSSQINQQHKHYVGSGSNTAYFFDGYLAEAVFIDGTAYAATSFGEFDEDSPNIWKPKNVSGLTFGTNGFYLDYEDSSNLGNDANGGTDFTEANLAAVDQCVDSPTNNFCTLNPLDNQRQGFTIIEGNTQITATPNYDFITGTMGVSAGKWYWEKKIITIPNLEYIYDGISDHVQWTANWDMGGEAGQYCLSRVAGKIKAAQGAETTYGGSMSANDIQGFALDADNNKLYISNGGAWSDGSGSWDSTTFDADTGAVTIAHATAIVGASDFWFPALGNGANVMVMSVNFGNPDYANSSSATDENGYGDFEFAPPTGYLALCSRNLGSDGG